jgi:RNA polymerase sigma-70 factor (ECF subfamily)
MVSSLLCCLGLNNFDLADDIIEETFRIVNEQWTDLQPDDYSERIIDICKTTTIQILQQKNAAGVSFNVQVDDMDERLDHAFEKNELRENQLRLLFTCCHPALTIKSQAILVLRNLCGLKIPEISRTLVMNDEAVSRNLSGSFKRLVDEEASLDSSIIMSSPSRLDAVHACVHFLFSEGYYSNHENDVVRRDLCVESMRLIRNLIDDSNLRNHDTFALFALMCLHASRFDSRIGTSGELLELELQDRSKWDRELIQVGVQYLKHAHASNEVTRFIIEAAIASVHCVAERFEDTNWEVIAGLYDRLSAIQSAPWVDLAHAASLYYSGSAEQALNRLQSSSHQKSLSNFYLYHVVLGKIYNNLGKPQEAVSAYEKALSLATLRAEQDFLNRKILTIQTHLN